MAAAADTRADGTFVLADLGPGDYRLRLAESNFRPPWGGVNWLSPTLVTPAVIAAWLWIWVGFAMIVIGAGLAAIPETSSKLPGSTGPASGRSSGGSRPRC